MKKFQDVTVSFEDQTFGVYNNDMQALQYVYDWKGTTTKSAVDAIAKANELNEAFEVRKANQGQAQLIKWLNKRIEDQINIIEHADTLQDKVTAGVRKSAYYEVINIINLKFNW